MRMKHRDLILLAGPICILVLMTIVVVMLFQQYRNFRDSYLADAKDDLRLRTLLIAENLEPELKTTDFSAMQRKCIRFRAHPTRVTIIDSGGRVVADSNVDISMLGNHLDRPEILEANIHDNFVIRYSASTDSHVLHYVVQKLGYYVRVSMPMATVDATLYRAKVTISLALFLGATLILGSFLYLIFRVRPHFIKLQSAATAIADGALDTPIEVSRGGLFRELSAAISKMACQLRHRIRDLQRLERFRSDFIANVSHEIKTPLTAILSTVELLSEQTVSEAQRTKCLDILSRQSRRLNNLVQDILSLAAIERRQGGAGDAAFLHVRCDNLLQDVVILSSDSAERAHIDLRLAEALPEVSVFADPHLLEQGLLNLIQNAIKHSGTKRIDVALSADEEQVSFTVRDYGTGIAQEHHARLFERFYRVHKERSRATGGTGLGLAIVKHIALLHKGTITVHSAMGEGAIFTLTLPRV